MKKFEMPEIEMIIFESEPVMLSTVIDTDPDTGTWGETIIGNNNNARGLF